MVNNVYKKLNKKLKKKIESIRNKNVDCKQSN